MARSRSVGIRFVPDAIQKVQFRFAKQMESEHSARSRTPCAWGVEVELMASVTVK